MSVAGGLSIAVGIWYQSVGGLVRLVAPWIFNGMGTNAEGAGSGIARQDELALLLEYFDMDAVAQGQAGLEFIQFKVSARVSPAAFSPQEVREILCSATKAILEHERTSEDRVVGFVLASNRPAGKHVCALEEAGSSLLNEQDPAARLSSFARLRAPSALFRKPSKRSGRNGRPVTACDAGWRTMRQLARSITERTCRAWGFRESEWTNACLKALATFRFANIKATTVSEELHRWLRSWGILPDEYATYSDHLLGALLSLSGTDITRTAEEVMRHVLDCRTAVPIRPCDVWADVIDDLRSCNQTAALSDEGIDAVGPSGWMLDRSKLLRGLPGSYVESARDGMIAEDGSCIDSRLQPRIFVLVGPGGVGKSILLRRLFFDVAGGVWDWDTSTLRNPTQFRGYPLMREAHQSALCAVTAALLKWGHRKGPCDRPSQRFAAASEAADGDPVVWLGLDGMDEVPDHELTRLARDLANFADDNPNVRLVLTCRPHQFELAQRYLGGRGLMRQLTVDEFDAEQAQAALFRATDGRLQLQTPLTGERLGVHSPEALQDSILQPLFVRAIRRVYVRDGIGGIEAACEGDLGALKRLAQEFVYDFCARVHARLGKSYILPPMIFRALKRLASDVEIPSAASASQWLAVCQTELDDHVGWNELYAQCAASGLITSLSGGAFEWRHPVVGQYLPEMQECP